MSLNNYKRSKIRTTESNIFIDKKDFPEIIRRLKVYSKSEGLKKCHNIWCVVDHYGWTTGYDTEGNVTKLNLRADKWTTKSMTLMSIMGNYIKSGGYIKLANENNITYWVYKFDGNMGRRSTMYNRVIDFEDKNDLEKSFVELASNMMRIGFTKTQLLFLIKKLFVSRILK